MGHDAEALPTVELFVGLKPDWIERKSNTASHALAAADAGLPVLSTVTEANEADEQPPLPAAPVSEVTSQAIGIGVISESSL